MRLGIISDIHGDASALDGALLHLERLGCEKVVCLGNVVGVGTEAVIALLRTKEIVTLLGAFDRMHMDGEPPMSPVLSSDARAWLQDLPSKYPMELQGVRVVMQHELPAELGYGMPLSATFPSDRQLVELLDHEQATAILVGHGNGPVERRFPGPRLVTRPGSISIPWAIGALSSPDSTTFGVLDLLAMKFFCHRVVDGKYIPHPLDRPSR